MKSRILKAALALVVPIVIEFITKKISEKIDQKTASKPRPQTPEPIGHS